jgi:predicted MFS family arabinose efflux permease
MAMVLVAMGLIVAFWGAYPVLLGAVCLWQIGGFAVNSFQQGRLVAMAPALASATVAMNTSVVYLGQAVGAKTGGALVRDGFSPNLPAVAMLFVAVAMIASVLASLRHRAA